MNLYDLHVNPKSLYGYDRVDMEVPSIFWEKYLNKPKELKKREAAIAKSSEYAFLYADEILHGPFEAGEQAIAKDPYYSFSYAAILRAPFLLGEVAISESSVLSYYYARDILRKPFPKGEIAIARDPNVAFWYERDILLSLRKITPV